MIAKNDTALAFFDLHEAPEDIQDEFFEMVSELVFDKVLEKAMFELQGTKRDELTEMLEISAEDPQNTEKQDAILTYLDENLPNCKEIVQAEIEELQKTYVQFRDELIDGTS